MCLPASESREKKEIGSTGKNHGENGVEIIISEKFLLAHHRVQHCIFNLQALKHLHRQRKTGNS